MTVMESLNVVADPVCNAIIICTENNSKMIVEWYGEFVEIVRNIFPTHGHLRDNDFPDRPLIFRKFFIIN